MKPRTLLLILILLSAAPLFAQDTGRPPGPPPIDNAADFDDMEEDLMEMGDEGFRPPPPPPPGGSSSPGGPGTMPGPPPPTFGGGGGAVGGGNFGAATSAAKMKFKVVEGEFWEKGKKRSRGKRASAR